MSGKNSGRDAFLVRHEIAGALEELADDQAGILLKMMMDYSITGETKRTAEPPTMMAFNFIKSQMDRAAEKYQKVCERNQKNGAKGGRPKTYTENTEKPKKPSGYIGNPKNPVGPNPNPSPNSNITLFKDPPYSPPRKKIIAQKTEEVIGYINNATGCHFKPRTYTSEVARILKDFTVEDIKTVVDFKAQEWMGDDRTVEWMRPKTLLRPTKFPKYLDEANAGKPKVKKKDFVDRLFEEA